MNRDLRILSYGGIAVRGSCEIDVGDYTIVLKPSALSNVIAIHRRGEKAPLRVYGAGSAAENLARALRYAGAIPSATALPPWPYQPSPECVEDAAGRCTNPMHNHTEEKSE